MMRSLYNGVSGLSNHQTKMDVISNNMANVNTIGFKKDSCQFRSIWYDTISGAPPNREGMAGINAKQVGLGSAVASTMTDFSQGSTERTNRTLDMSINGLGFFIMEQGDTTAYTRAGSFVLDANGVLSDPATGYKVQGWMGENGIVNAMGKVEDIVVPVGLKKEARSTTRIETQCNLNQNHGPNFGDSNESVWQVNDVDGNTIDISVQYVKTGGDTWTWTMTDLTNAAVIDTGALEINNEGDIVVSETTGGSSQINYTFPAGSTAVTLDLPPAGINLFEDPESFSYTISNNGTADVFTATYERDYHDVATTVYDEFGTAHDLTIRFEKVIDAISPLDTWTWEVQNATDVDVSSVYTSVNGNVGFQGNGVIRFNSDGTFANCEVTNDIIIDPNSSAGNIAITPDLTMTTQFDSEYTTQVVDQNGFPMGVMQGINIDEQGHVNVIFSNGVTDPYARIATKVFTNPEGLSKVGDTYFSETYNSGEGMVMAPETSSAGSILSGTLEMSNVDLAEEFTDMITTQRGFQANTRVITTSDEMLTDLIGLKR